MDFYDELSKYYDIVFPVTQNEAIFLSSQFPRLENAPQNVLDVGCGTGSQSLILADLGHLVTGIDLEQEMVEKAQAKAGEKCRFLVADMTDLPFEDKKFDGVICLGNTLAHARDEQATNQALSQMCRVIRPGGKLILQVVNYDRVIRLGTVELPVISSAHPEILFRRFYRHVEGDRVFFDSTLEVNGQMLRSQLPMTAITLEVVETFANQSKLRIVETWGNFCMDPYRVDSPSLIVKLERY